MLVSTVLFIILPDHRIGMTYFCYDGCNSVWLISQSTVSPVFKSMLTFSTPAPYTRIYSIRLPYTCTPQLCFVFINQWCVFVILHHKTQPYHWHWPVVESLAERSIFTSWAKHTCPLLFGEPCSFSGYQTSPASLEVFWSQRLPNTGDATRTTFITEWYYTGWLVTAL